MSLMPSCGCAVCQGIRSPGSLSDEEFDAFLKGHPLDPVDAESVERSVQNLRKRLNQKTEEPRLGL